ncbi:hypothetical protein FVE85_1938 [Porphyridium purpureum]|uniref:Uncharacterized protein n=1 Tax=Porphyridium purpureum TaxID=35688 RepID=A0A5J4YYS9_PORPP|nr:hypothetical protein FVE85_1938 [Porphyridium purpureum]|eukprot:POR8696..scf209_3
MAAQSSSRARLAVAKFLGASSAAGADTETLALRSAGSTTTANAHPAPLVRGTQRPNARGGVGLTEEQQALRARTRELSKLEKLAASNGRGGGGKVSRGVRNDGDGSSEQESDSDDAAESRTQSAKRRKLSGEKGSRADVASRGAGHIEAGYPKHDHTLRAESPADPDLTKTGEEGVSKRPDKSDEYDRAPRKKKKTRSRQKNLRRDTRTAEEKPAHLTETTLKLPRLARRDQDVREMI